MGNSRRRKEEVKDNSTDSMQELAVIVKEKVKDTENNVVKRLVSIIPKLRDIKPFASIPPPFTDGLLKSYMNGKLKDIWVLTSSDNPNSENLKITPSYDKYNLLLCFEKVDKNIFTLAMV